MMQRLMNARQHVPEVELAAVFSTTGGDRTGVNVSPVLPPPVVVMVEVVVEGGDDVVDCSGCCV